LIRQESGCVPNPLRSARDEFQPLDRPDLLLELSPPRRKLLLLGDLTAVRPFLADILFLPERTNQVARTDGVAVCLRMRPDQCLVLLESEMQAARVRERLRRSAEAAYVLDAGSRFVGFTLSRAASMELLNSGCSLDLRLRSLPVDRCAGTRIEQVPVWILRQRRESFELWVERPLASYLWRWLVRAAESVDHIGAARVTDPKLKMSGSAP
jgi:heterotetrameric sarcosine oxidase gamma subunit